MGSVLWFGGVWTVAFYPKNILFPSLGWADGWMVGWMHGCHHNRRPPSTFPFAPLSVFNYTECKRPITHECIMPEVQGSEGTVASPWPSPTCLFFI